MMSRLASQNAQTKKIKNALQNFKNETYILMKPDIDKIEEEFKHDKLSNILAKLCEHWMDTKSELDKLKHQHEAAEWMMQNLITEKNGLESQITNYEVRLSNLIEESNEQIQDTENEITKYQETVNTLNSELKKTKNNNEEYRQQTSIEICELKKKISDLENLLTEKSDKLKKIENEVKKSNLSNNELREENKSLKINIEHMARIIETKKNIKTHNEEDGNDSEESDLSITGLDLTQNGNNFTLLSSTTNKTLQEELDEANNTIINISEIIAPLNESTPDNDRESESDSSFITANLSFITVRSEDGNDEIIEETKMDNQNEHAYEKDKENSNNKTDENTDNKEKKKTEKTDDSKGKETHDNNEEHTNDKIKEKPNNENENEEKNDDVKEEEINHEKNVKKTADKGEKNNNIKKHNDENAGRTEGRKEDNSNNEYEDKVDDREQEKQNGKNKGGKKNYNREERKLNDEIKNKTNEKENKEENDEGNTRKVANKKNNYQTNKKNPQDRDTRTLREENSKDRTDKSTKETKIGLNNSNDMSSEDESESKNRKKLSPKTEPLKSQHKRNGEIKKIIPPSPEIIVINTENETTTEETMQKKTEEEKKDTTDTPHRPSKHTINKIPYEDKNRKPMTMNTEYTNKKEYHNPGVDIIEKLRKLEKSMGKATQRIKKIEEKISSEQLKTDKNTDKENKQHTNKPKCYLLGDSHLRYIDEEIKKDTDWTNKYEVRTSFVPGYRIEDILNELIPRDIQREDILVLCGGTNDLYYTSTESIKNQINFIGNIGCKTILISIPPQNSHTRNQDIIRLNTLIKYECEKFQHVYIINTHKFIRRQNLAQDGVHLGRKAKIWLASKITKTIEKITSSKQLKQTRDKPPQKLSGKEKINYTRETKQKHNKQNQWTIYENYTTENDKRYHINNQNTDINSRNRNNNNQLKNDARNHELKMYNSKYYKNKTLRNEKTENTHRKEQESKKDTHSPKKNSTIIINEERPTQLKTKENLYQPNKHKTDENPKITINPEKTDQRETLLSQEQNNQILTNQQSASQLTQQARTGINPPPINPWFRQYHEQTTQYQQPGATINPNYAYWHRHQNLNAHFFPPLPTQYIQRI
uniref:Uncharacterized protein n=1 Tax=Cacopsylla melanoneura TaxID=428564 RepID=A0A8D8SXP4_9HEMI